MRNLALLIALTLTSLMGYSQQDKEVRLNKETNLIEATYFHANGEISQEGTFNLDGKLQGDWVSFDEEGKKNSEGSYANGAKTGKWFFWNVEGSMKEVEFSDNSITYVIHTQSANGVLKQ